MILGSLKPNVFLNKFLADAGIYVGSSIVVKAVPFLLIPIFTRYLTPEDYGFLGIFNAVVGILSIVIGVNTFIFTIVKYHQFERRELYQYNANSLLIIGLSALLSFGILFLIKALFFQDLPAWTLVAAVMLGVTGSIMNLYLSMLQMERKAVRYGLLQGLQAVLAGIIPLGFVLLWWQNWEGKVLGSLLAGLLTGLISFFYLRKYVVFKISKRKLKEILEYCLPLIFHTLGLWGINSIDRFFLVSMVTLEEAGKYTVAYSFGMIIGIIHDALLKAWSPVFYQKIKNASDRTKKIMVKYTYIYWVLSFVCFVIFAIIIDVMFPLLVGKNFVDAVKYIPWILLAYTFNGLTKTVMGYIYHIGRTKIIAMITFLSLIVNAIANYFLISCFGSLGAAYATVLAFAAQFCLMFFFAYRFYPMPWLNLKKGDKNAEVFK